MFQKICIRVFKILVSGVLIYLVLKGIGIIRVVDVLREADLAWLAGGLVLFSMSHVLGSLQWWFLLDSEKIRLSWKRCLSFYYVGLFFNNFFIGSLGGDVFRMVDIRRYSRNGTGAVSTVMIDRFIGLFVLSGMAVFSSVWTLFRGKMHPDFLILMVVLICGWIFVILFMFNRTFARPFAWLIRRIIPRRMAIKTREVYDKIQAIGHERGLLIRLIGLSVVVQSLRIMMHYAIAVSLDVKAAPLSFFLIVPIIAIVASLPISLGGIGLREQTGIILFAGIGIAALQAFTIEFMAYVLAVISSLPGGLIFLARRKVEVQDNSILISHSPIEGGSQ